MAQETKHTQGLWRIGLNNTTAIICETLEGKVPTIAKMSQGYADVEEAEENALFICKAVNSHHKLVEALRLVLREKYRQSEDIGMTDIEHKAEELLKSLK